jgi:hypothetical protein
MATASVSRQIAAIKKSAEKMEAAKPAAVGTASVGDVVRQGDLYLVCLESLPPGTKTRRQLAPGETQGSRHVAEGDCEVYQPREPAAVSRLVGVACRGADVPAELVGPIVECHGDTTITHPEHGHRILPGGTVWAVVYQRAYAEEIRRVQD